MSEKAVVVSLVWLLCAACSETPVPSSDESSAYDATTNVAPSELRQQPLGGGAAPAEAGVDCSPVPRGGINPNRFPDMPCDDREPQRGTDLSDAPLGVYSIDCDPQPLDTKGCQGIPSDIWSRCAHKQCAARHSYPKGCGIALPTQKPELSRIQPKLLLHGMDGRRTDDLGLRDLDGLIYPPV